MAKAAPLQSAVKAGVASVKRKDVQSALAVLVSRRLKNRQRLTQRMQPPTPAAQPAKVRAAQRRSGKNRSYTPTTLWNSARHGTWRRHMIETIREHTATHAAAAANASCGIEKFASQRLDFNWAADNGYITWND